jgi:hypothetical protein
MQLLVLRSYLFNIIGDTISCFFILLVCPLLYVFVDSILVMVLSVYLDTYMVHFDVVLELFCYCRLFGEIVCML